MKNISEISGVLKQIIDLLEQEFGQNCEIVLHDLTGEYDHSIVDIRNGHITNRKIGGCGSNLGLEVLSGQDMDGDRFNYITTTHSGKILRSSSIYFRDDNNKVIGSLCVNLDITESLRFSSFLQQYNGFNVSNGECFAQDVGSLLEFLIQQAKSHVGKEPTKLNKEERLQFLKYLDERGAFRISKSSVKICEILNISKFTLYSDLEKIKSGECNNENID